MSRLVRVQKTQIRKKNKGDSAGFEGSPYWNYLHRKAGGTTEADGSGPAELTEPNQANPDVLSEEAAMYHVSAESREKQRLVQTAMKRTKLSKRERDVLELLTYTDRTQEQVADLFGISQPVVSIYYKRALTKIKKFIEKENK